MLDANSTFMAVERSRSGIGAPLAGPGLISPLGNGAGGFAALQNQAPIHIFNTTLQRNLRGRNNSNLNQVNKPGGNMNSL